MDKEIMNVSVENLAQKQYEFLLAHGTEILNKIFTDIKLGKYAEIKKMLAYSPSGDGYGEDNYYINFAYNPGEDIDIQCYINMLERLDNARQGKK